MAKKSIKTGKLSSSRMPGFYAEASLYNAHERYRSVYFSTATDTGRVLPQFCITNEGGTTCCECYFGWCYCHHLIRAVLQ